MDIDGPTVYPVAPNNQAYLNFSLTNSSGLIINQNSFTIAFDGTVLDKNKEGQSYPLPSLPTQFAMGKDVQIFISEHTLQSTLISLHTARLFKVSPVDGVSADAVSLLFDNFSQVFGNDKLARIVLSTIDPPPTIVIMENRTLVDLSATISVRNPLNYDLDAIIINTTMSMEIYPLVTPDFNLSMSLKTLSL